VNNLTLLLFLFSALSQKLLLFDPKRA